MRRLRETLTAPSEPEPVAPALSMPSYSPSVAASEPAPAMAPLSQAGFEFASAAPPGTSAPAEELLEEVPAPEPAPEPQELQPVSEVRAKVHPPSEVNIPAIRAPEPEPLPLVEEPNLDVEEVEPALTDETPPPAPSPKALEETKSIPLISHPDDDEPPSSPKPAPLAKKEAPRSRFSWKRK
jgi:hypothetical protein